MAPIPARPWPQPIPAHGSDRSPRPRSRRWWRGRLHVLAALVRLIDDAAGEQRFIVRMRRDNQHLRVGDGGERQQACSGDGHLEGDWNTRSGALGDDRLGHRGFSRKSCAGDIRWESSSDADTCRHFCNTRDPRSPPFSGGSSPWGRSAQKNKLAHRQNGRRVTSGCGGESSERPAARGTDAQVCPQIEVTRTTAIVTRRASPLEPARRCLSPLVTSSCIGP